ncbi:MAG: hypothetical protein LBG83_05560 [Oscillospiraceae bacterium]|jgi:hypothetical protein|nr:hypothetical protein [Oscillospiraceae bacterium]
MSLQGQTNLPYFTFSDEEMLEYLNTVDPFLLKYGLQPSNPGGEFHEKELELLNRIHRYEETFGPMAGRDDDAGKTHENLKLIYGTAEPIDLFTDVVHQVRDKIITRMLSVEGLTRLFNIKYFSYEWLMHMEIYDDKQEFNHYRDHFIHQVKDAYSMVRLLAEVPNLEQRLLRDFMQSNVNINAYLNKQADRMAHHMEHQRDWLQIYLRLAELRWLENKNGEQTEEDADGALEQNKAAAERIINHMETGCYSNHPRERRMYERLMEYARKEILRVTMYEAIVMAGLFHDLGYPIAYTLRNKENLSEMIPTAHFFIESLDHFTEINGMLSGSLLFRVVEATAIRDAVAKKVHGALSALAFLLYFYENGAIQRMDALDSAAIEVAALMIFDHTLRYTVIDDDPAAFRYHRGVYYRNPLSFLLRFVDDIQEWGRVYFNIRTNRSLRICQRCHMPIVECKLASLRSDETQPPAVWRRGLEDGRWSGLSDQIYLCGCEETNPPQSISALWERKQTQAETTGLPPDNAFFLLQDIAYRKINHVKHCYRIHFYRASYNEERHDPTNLLFLPNYADDLTGEGPPIGPLNYEKPPDRLLLHIEYDPFKMLQMTMVQPDFSRYRSSELNKVRKLLRNQANFIHVGLYALTTNNPLILKTRMLENFLTDWYTRFAKAEKLLAQLKDETYQSTSLQNTLMQFILPNNGNLVEPDFNTLVSELLRLRNAVLAWLHTNQNPTPDLLDTPGVSDVLSGSSRWAEIERLRPEIERLETALPGLYVDQAAAFQNENNDAIIELSRQIANDERSLKTSKENLDKKETAAKNLLLRIFMLLAENPRWLVGDVEHIKVGDPDLEALHKENDNLMRLLASRRYEPHRILLGTNENFVALLRLIYTMRSRCYNAERLQSYTLHNNWQSENEDYRRLRDCICEQVAEGCENSDYRRHMAAHLDFYANLFYVAKYYCAEGAAKKQIQEKIAEVMKDSLVSNFIHRATFGSSLRELVINYFEQECSHPHYHECAKGFHAFPESYYDTYKIPAPLINAVDCYCRSQNYADRKVNSGSDMLDLHSDLYMFFRISFIWSERVSL